MRIALRQAPEGAALSRRQRPSQHAHGLEGANDAPRVRGVDARGRDGVERAELGEHPVRVARPRRFEGAPQRGVGPAGEREPAERGAQVQSGAALDDDRHATGQDVVDGRVGGLGVGGHRPLVPRVDEADEVEPGPRHELRRRLVGEDRQAAVHLHRVGDDDLGAQALRQRHGDLGLAEARGAEQGDHAAARVVSHAAGRPRGSG